MYQYNLVITGILALVLRRTTLLTIFLCILNGLCLITKKMKFASKITILPLFLKFLNVSPPSKQNLAMPALITIYRPILASGSCGKYHSHSAIHTEAQLLWLV